MKKIFFILSILLLLFTLVKSADTASEDNDVVESDNNTVEEIDDENASNNDEDDDEEDEPEPEPEPVPVKKKQTTQNKKQQAAAKKQQEEAKKQQNKGKNTKKAKKPIEVEESTSEEDEVPVPPPKKQEKKQENKKQENKKQPPPPGANKKKAPQNPKYSEGAKEKAKAFNQEEVKEDVQETPKQEQKKVETVKVETVKAEPLIQPPQNPPTNDEAEKMQFKTDGTPAGDAGLGDPKDRASLMEDWEQYMSDFVPDEMLTFEVDGKKEETFYEEIEQETNIRGAYFVSYFSNEKITFMIRNPKGRIVYSKNDKREGIFSVNVTEIGTYTFQFDNRRGKDKKTITFALDVRNTTQEHLQHSHLDPVQKSLDHIANNLRDFHTESRFSAKRVEAHSKKFKSTHNKLLFLSVVETLAIIGTSVWQIYYIKKILDNRRIV